MHQGDLKKVKGVRHINVVSEVTQYQFAGCVERDSECDLVPVLEKLCVEDFTKPRPRRSNDNSLMESKNGRVIRRQHCDGHSP